MARIELVIQRSRPRGGTSEGILVIQRATDSGVGIDCEVEDIEHSEESEEEASEEEDVWSRCVTTSNPYGL